MRKFRLDIDRLTVESFPTAQAAMERGTVDAHASGPAGCSARTLCDVASCVVAATCDYSICRPCPTV